MTKPISKSLMGATSMLMILSVLRQKDSYGYEISKIILKVSDGRIDWQAGSLYPMLKKIEKQGLIKSDWIIEDNSRARRYYTILEKGLKEIDELREEWQLLCSILNILNENAELKIQ
ncbi:PadR family transcriptional regulator [uncultured Draconibacterium sp.]|uniref:PadR family transcriptional regulator n=1 Tax=uncultured Draconibacterium sp. TaxID=1573823 RepID=UPI0032179D67